MVRVLERRIRRSDRVAVRALAEILPTLDAFGALEGLPFLPEMEKYCGRTFAVRRIVTKFVQEGVEEGMRRIVDVVLLDGPICDGEAHEGCQRACFPLWKTAWLAPAETPERRGRVRDEIAQVPGGGEPEPSRVPRGKGCQVTDLTKASAPLRFWDPRRHLWDLTSGIYRFSELPRFVLRGLSEKTFGRMFSKFRRRRVTLRSPRTLERLDLQAGDLVEVRSPEEIRLTFDGEGKIGALYFMPGMWKYCGGRFRVLGRVDRMISERTGGTVRLADTVILEGAVCDGKAHDGCQRGCYAFWKESWLRRAGGPGQNPERATARPQNG